MSQPPQGEAPQGAGQQDAGQQDAGPRQQPGPPPPGRPAHGPGPAQPAYPPPPGYPQPGGYPPQQGGYPPQGYPGQPYGSPPQGGYGFVGAGVPAGPGGPYGPPPYGPGGRPPRQQGKSRTGLFVLIGAVALALVLVVVAVTVHGRTPEAGGGSTTGGGGASAPAATASDAVQGYLQAVATGDATTAVSYAADPSTVNPVHLTPGVLAASAKAAPMTDVQVTPVDDPDATTVPVSYKLGKTDVSTSIDVLRTSDDVWKLVTVTTELDLTAVQEDGVPMLMNGARVGPGTFSLLPGLYHFTSGQRNFSYGSHPDLLVRYPSDSPDTSRVEAQTSSKGRAAALSALQKSWKSCLRSDDPEPSGCPNRWDDGSTRFKKGTVSWTREGADPVRKPQRSDYATSTVFTVKINLALHGTCTSGGRTGRCNATLSDGTALARAEYSGDGVKVTWQT